MNPLISVIMSTKDTEKEMLKVAVDSILFQTYENFEFFICVDGSEKDYEFLSQYQDSRIRLIQHETSVGLTKSLNELLTLCQGDYIARMDSDDISLKDRFQIQVEFLNSHSDVDVCSTFYEYIGNRSGYHVDPFYKSNEKKAELLIYNQIAHPGVMMRKSFLVQNHLFYNEEYIYSQDYELWSRCSRLTNLYVIPKVCLQYRVHDNQISTAKVTIQNELCRGIYQNYLKELGFSNFDHLVEFLMYFSKKSQSDFSYVELEHFIQEVLDHNLKQSIYHPRILKQILYYRLFVVKRNNMSFASFVSCVIHGKLLSLFMKKVWLTCKVKLLKRK